MKRVLSIILAIVMLVSSMSNILVFASDESTALETGDTVVLYAFLSDNPGVSELVLSFEYDSSAMNLVKVSNGEAMSDATYTGPKNLASGCMATWYYIDEPDYFKDGSLVALEFEIVDSEAMGDTYPLSVVIVSAEGANGTVFDLKDNIRVIDYRPGDVNGDGIHSLRYDVSEFNQYIVDGCKYDPLGYAVQINENAADVNNDGVITIKDVIDVNKYIVDGGVYDPNGYAVKLYPHIEVCKHTSLIAVPAKEATCTENGNKAYWDCEDCEKLFSDVNGTTEITLEETVVLAKHIPGAEPTCTEAQTCTKCGGVLQVATGHKEVSVPGYAATLEKEGLTDGIKCSVCGKWVVKQEVIDKLLPAQHSITYIVDAGDYIDQGDAYLQAQTITNPNPKTFNENELVELKKLSTPGYTFDGWVDQTGTRWDVIPAGTNKNLILYAKWTQNVYTVNFDSPDNPVNSVTYTIDKGVTFTNPSAYKYTFIGWSNDDGFIVDRVDPGTTGDMTLRANWTSDRNFATSYSDYGEPIIIEDNERNQFLFVYDIGKIDNVPLYTYKRANGELIKYNNTTVDFSETSTLKTEFTREDAQNIAKTVANATTRSSGWTLSEEWESVLSESKADKDKLIKSEERTDSKGKTIGDTYFVSNSEGGSSYASVESGGSSSSSAKVTTEDSFGINTSYDKSTEKYCDAELSTGFKNETELSAGISAPVGIAKVEAGVKNTTTITADANLKSGRKDNEAFHVDTSSSSFVGTDFSSSSSSHYNAVTSNSTNWNSSNSYEKSADMSEETTVAAAIASEIESTTSYNISNALSGAKDNTESVSGTTSDETGYSNSVTVSEYFSEENVYVESHKDDHVGYHRLVEAGIVHVYAVVGYDIATASYYTYTFNVLEDDTYAYWDYSLSDPSFTDCENGLVTFEIPFEVNEYIAGVTGQTEGLEIGFDDKGYGCVNAFEATADFNGDVVVPQYLGANNLDDTYDPVVVTSFTADAFRGNTEINTVILPMYVTEIPDYAFEGCTNLETVIAYGVTKIGDYAFKDCTKLGLVNAGTSNEKYGAFMIDNMVTELGVGAFMGVNELKVMAYDSSVADAAINSGAKKITVDLTKLKDSYSGNKTIQSSVEYFGLIGGGKTYSGLIINSDAKETFISNMTFANNTSVPLNISSETVMLARVTVENAPGLALILSADNTALKLYRNVTLSSMSNNSVLSKNVTLSKANTGITGSLDFDGKYLVSGEITNTSMLSNPENIVNITDDEYAKYTETVVVSFSSNGGTKIDSIETGYDTIVEEPNAPTKKAHSFLGWYTDEACKTEFDFSTPVTSDITLYAKWELNEFTLTLDPCEGTVSPTSKAVVYGEKYGTLPTPTRTGYTFNGWYTATNGGTKIIADTTVSATADHTLYAQWKLNTYKVSWSNATGVTISVKRTSSPYANAPTGSLSTGNTVNYGDVLTITYTANTGYTLATKGKTSVTVTGNVTASDIYATATVNSYKATWSIPTGGLITVKRTSSPLAGATTGTLSSGNTVYHGDVLSVAYSAQSGYSITGKGATSVTVSSSINSNTIYLIVSPNEYTYNIVYKSSNGTSLGIDTVRKAFNTTNTITPKTFAGYDTPSTQSVKWDSTSAKTITFVYTPTAVAFTKVTGQHYTDPITIHTAVAEYRNRTATTVEMRITWTDQITEEWHYNYNSQRITATIGGVKSAEVIVVPWGAWEENVKVQPAKTNSTAWVTVAVSADTTSVPVSVYHRQTNIPGNTLGSDFTKTFTAAIPKY